MAVGDSGVGVAVGGSAVVVGSGAGVAVAGSVTGCGVAVGCSAAGLGNAPVGVGFGWTTGVGGDRGDGGVAEAGLAAAARGVGETAAVGAAVGAVGVAVGADAEPQASSSPTVSNSRLKTPIDRKNN